jgi:hypothetical protein
VYSSFNLTTVNYFVHIAICKYTLKNSNRGMQQVITSLHGTEINNPGFRNLLHLILALLMTMIVTIIIIINII